MSSRNEVRRVGEKEGSAATAVLGAQPWGNGRAPYLSRVLGCSEFLVSSPMEESLDFVTRQFCLRCPSPPFHRHNPSLGF